MPPWILGEERFNSVYPHKGSIKALWETKWKFCSSKSIYPFHDGAFEDFEPIFEKLIAENINDPFTDAYTSAFTPVVDALEKEADAALASNQAGRASDLYRRAAVVLRISRFPYVSPTTRPSNQAKRAAFNRQKDLYLKASALWTPVLKEEVIPHTHRASNDGPSIPLYIRLPVEASASNPVPRTHEITNRGWAAVIAEIPGTADSPADPADPESADRLWSSVLDFIAQRPELDDARVAVWGLSAGGFYAIRAACTHRKRLIGAMAHGAGSHHFLSPEWLSKVNDHEYPFTITDSWAEKYGYETTEEFIRDSQKKFSLVETGVVDQPNCRLLLLNGVDDGVVPIEDSLILFNHGGPKEGRFFEGMLHMGYPNSLPVSYKWLEDLLSPNASEVKN
ncbi:Heptaketide hydrolyase ayg1 [Penicillium chermesinum]|nr:Heptaketide hydrolyase ayg1 [Penicillium chermesinum]